ncbi:translation initiation factor IF-2-like isoform X1 [Lagopus muta]|uniref:translation initiation factor IF-2-like isoform X1 n=1 Tax=Lagopus muta TaxID=64668 RepID=UPI0020A18B3B|nr:translation initiation factor IF-2-like isoform X1 [Lagopus muta]XP_048785503.1 translation initiation factor IF-2-like isoform X1 [Lagopus muta]XP_048785504.1 translation initiation factor IF-2-like isoform X1 [Lagopus muta]XP_048785505.1 translation initiation factor IF-2-like isoform X1 [Lagopus muta]XP_048785507.1 translation initiation factor IF-2-like isoform X1 [Lagopus muta]XP_048785508.1 translation initiation factor IF-2-like isoform X1 [Lagopus muta]XP_048785509.1 translation in
MAAPGIAPSLLFCRLSRPSSPGIPPQPFPTRCRGGEGTRGERRGRRSQCYDTAVCAAPSLPGGGYGDGAAYWSCRNDRGQKRRETNGKRLIHERTQRQTEKRPRCQPAPVQTATLEDGSVPAGDGQAPRRLPPTARRPRGTGRAAAQRRFPRTEPCGSAATAEGAGRCARGPFRPLSRRHCVITARPAGPRPGCPRRCLRLLRCGNSAQPAESGPAAREDGGRAVRVPQRCVQPARSRAGPGRGSRGSPGEGRAMAASAAGSAAASSAPDAARWRTLRSAQKPEPAVTSVGFHGTRRRGLPAAGGPE